MLFLILYNSFNLKKKNKKTSSINFRLPRLLLTLNLGYSSSSPIYLITQNIAPPSLRPHTCTVSGWRDCWSRAAIAFPKRISPVPSPSGDISLLRGQHCSLTIRKCIPGTSQLPSLEKIPWFFPPQLFPFFGPNLKISMKIYPLY